MWENLLHVLGEYRADSPVYLGQLIRQRLPHGYTSGGAGYLLSKPAVRTIVDEASQFPADCPRDGAIEDYDIGRYTYCCSEQGPNAGNSRVAISRAAVNRERKCADTMDTVLVPLAGHFEC